MPRPKHQSKLRSPLMPRYSLKQKSSKQLKQSLDQDKTHKKRVHSRFYNVMKDMRRYTNPNCEAKPIVPRAVVKRMISYILADFNNHSSPNYIPGGVYLTEDRALQIQRSAVDLLHVTTEAQLQRAFEQIITAYAASQPKREPVKGRKIIAMKPSKVMVYQMLKQHEFMRIGDVDVRKDIYAVLDLKELRSMDYETFKGESEEVAASAKEREARPHPIQLIS